MKNNDIVAKICSLPEQLERVNDKSLVQLLKDTGVKKSKEAISVEGLKNYLRNNAGLVENWLLYSMNKRIDEGWYFEKENKVTYIVGYLFKNTSRKEELKYSDAIQACAIFIHNELADICNVYCSPIVNSKAKKIVLTSLL